MPNAWMQVEIGDDLPAIGAGVSGEIVVATGGFRRDEVGVEAA